MFPINAHDFYGGGCSCCSGKGKFFNMEEEAVHMPVVDISFAPTKAFVGAFGEAEARKQGEKFVQPTWAQKLNLGYRMPPPDAKAAEEDPPTPKEVIMAQNAAMRNNPLLTRDEAVAIEAQQVPPAAFLVVGGIFLAGAATALFVAWRLGALSTAIFTSP